MAIEQQQGQPANQDEQYRREVKEHLSNLINRIPIGVYLFVSSADGGMRFDFVSPRFCEIYNIPEEEFMRDPSVAFNSTHPDDYESLITANKHAIDSGKIFSWEGRFIVDGEMKWVEINSEPNQLSNGDILWSGLMKDITERKLIEEALTKRQGEHEEAQKIAHLGHWDLDLVDNELVWSDENYRIFGVKPGTVNTYDTFLKTVHPDDYEFVDTAYKESVKNNTPYNIEHRLLMQDGSIKWVNEACKTFYDDNGTPLRSIGTTLDITERINLLKDLKVKNSILSIQQETSPDAILVVDENAMIASYNQRFVELWNIPEDLVIAGVDEPVLQTVVSQVMDSEAFLSRVRYLYEHREESSHEELLLRDGRVIDRYSAPVFGERKQYYGRIWYFRDITERRQNELEFRKLSQAVNSAGEGIIITDENAVIDYVNPAFSNITGYGAEEAIGKTPAMLKSHAQDPSFYKDLWETITRGEVWSGTLIDRKKDGSFYPAMMSVAPIHDDQGEITHYVSLQQDMTEHRQLEEQLLQSQKMEAVGTLVGGIAHDFNNMLAGIAGNVFLAKRKAGDNTEVVEKLDRVETLGGRAADMIKQLLIFARKDKVTMKTVMAASFFKEALRLAESGVPENINLSYNISEEQMLIQGDSTQLQQLIMNLLNNARDAVSGVSKPAIHCQLEPFSADDSFRIKHPENNTDNFIHLLVSDNGHGIPQDKLDRIFEPFFTTKSVGKGSGLGLSMVFGAVERHNGIIELQSEVGEGTVFHIYLPQVEQQPETISDKQVDIIQGQGEKILFIDDDDIMRSTTAEVLRGLGYEVLVSVDGKQGLETFKSNMKNIDLIITDLVMPEMGGLELAQAVRQFDGAIPIILATGYDMDDVLVGDIPLDNSLVISKPFSFSDLSQLIQKIIKTK
ncbi:blue-light-activated protein [Mariprofundus micogutta]|uniref:histidine kinase n=1 Tax=Mariprofundus micogutta TaxID=1921010 RepID=A0A1L8CND8_9PROT|nr:PAS domain S-box protein [Mariprofundus micogutta]GAV20417.1 blue-light-activated protein [Mariprofundus micogutta]